MHNIKTIFFVVINDCRVFLDDYFDKGVVAGAVAVFLYCTILLSKFISVRNMKRNRILCICMKIPFVALLGCYCYLVLGITVLSRQKEAVYILNPVPFSTWGTDIANLIFWIENILMMIPLGILLYILWKPFRKLGWSLLFGFFFSLSIECIQLCSRRGKFETDDIMNNVVGMVIGFLICKGVDRVLSFVCSSK